MGIPAPTLIFGQSLGEYSALCQANYLSQTEAMSLLEYRSELIAETPPAKMILVKCKNDNAIIILPSGIELSTRLSKSSLVFVGDPLVIEDHFKMLKLAGVECRLLKTTHGFHSSRLVHIKERIRSKAESILFSSERMEVSAEVISNLDGEILDASRVNAEYLAEHLIQPVRLDLAMKMFVFTN